MDLILAGKNSKADKKGLAFKLDQLDRDRLLRLRKATKTGEIVRTKNGVFEAATCSDCGLHHKVSLFLKHQLPCPGTRFGKLYYSTHKEEKSLMESFSLDTKLSNLVLKQKKSIAKTRSDYKPQIHQEDSKRLIRSAQSGKSNPNIAESVAKEVEGVSVKEIDSVPVKKTGSVTAKEIEDMVLKEIEGVAVKETVNIPENQEETLFSANPKQRTWNDVFSVSETCSDLGDVEGSEKSIGGMQRQLIREMYTQEEEALRLRLAQEQERNNRDSRYKNDLARTRSVPCTQA